MMRTCFVRNSASAVAEKKEVFRDAYNRSILTPDVPAGNCDMQLGSGVSFMPSTQGIHAGPGTVGSFFFTLGLDAKITHLPEDDGFPSGRGTTELVIRGSTISLDISAPSRSGFLIPNAFGL